MNLPGIDADGQEISGKAPATCAAGRARITKSQGREAKDVARKKKYETAGHPKTYQSGEELIELWTEYCDEIAEQGYIQAPTQTDFCRWLKRRETPADAKTIYTTLNKYFPNIKAEFEKIRADTIAAGAMLGHYQQSITIFALKNWAGWTDKQEVGNLDGKPFRQSIDLTELSDEELMAMADE